MTDRPVLWTRTARRDLEDIVASIAEESPTRAVEVLDRLEHRAERLSTLGTRGRIVPELREIGVDRYRELIEAPWRIVYRAEAEQTIVLAVLDARRDLADTLLARLVRS